MGDITKLTDLVIKFRDARDWKQFHNPKDCSLSLILEASELAEHFQWKNEKEMADHLEKHKDEVGEELADVLYWVLLMSNDLEIDIEQALTDKIVKNDQKYPVKKAKGKHTKYDKL